MTTKVLIVEEQVIEGGECHSFLMRREIEEAEGRPPGYYDDFDRWYNRQKLLELKQIPGLRSWIRQQLFKLGLLDI